MNLDIDYGTVQAKTGFHPHETQIQVLEEMGEQKINLVVAGRRWGKTMFAADRVLKKSFERNKVIWWGAPTFELSKRGMKYLIPWTQRHLPGLYKLHKSERMLENLMSGSQISFKSADRPEQMVGEGLDYFVGDEISQTPEETWAEYIYPCLSDPFADGEALLITSLSARTRGQSWLKELFDRGQDGDPEVKSWRFTSLEGMMKEEDYYRAKRMINSLAFEEQYNAAFLSDTGSVFRGVQECIRGKWAREMEGKKVLREPEVGHVYVMGVDLAKLRDYSVFYIIDKTDNQIVYMDRFTDLDYRLQIARAAEASKHYNEAAVYVDATGVGEGVMELFYDEGVNAIPFYIKSNKVKRELIDDLVIAIEYKRLFFPYDKVTIKELTGYSYDISPHGVLRYSAPSGKHDDCVVALALAYHGAGYELEAVKEPEIKPVSLNDKCKAEMQRAMDKKHKKEEPLLTGLRG